jgi:hypothetical protein
LEVILVMQLKRYDEKAGDWKQCDISW